MIFPFEKLIVLCLVPRTASSGTYPFRISPQHVGAMARDHPDSSQQRSSLLTCSCEKNGANCQSREDIFGKGNYGASNIHAAAVDPSADSQLQ
jgi:hypothetical protein